MLSNKNKTKAYLIDEVEQLEEDLNLRERDLEFYVSEYNKLVKQKFILVQYLKEHDAKFTLNKIKEIEHDTNNDSR